MDLIKQPKTTLYYFIQYFNNETSYNYLKNILYYFSFVYTYYYLTNLLGIFQILNWNLINFVYWFGLGVSSSIGLGFGIHTGFLILFPLVVKVAIMSTKCNNFEIYGDDAFICRDINQNENIDLNIFKIYKKIFIESFAWALGTAFGEVPPYLISRFDRLNRSNSVDFSSFTDNKFMRFMNKITVDLLLKYRFWAILLLSSYPNVAFDLCGIASGHYLIPFYEFISATIIGKAIIKTPIQCYLLISLFISNTIEKNIIKLPEIISGPILNLIDSYKIKLINPNVIENNYSLLSIISYLWNFTIIILVIYFIKSLIETIANKQSKYINQ